MLTLLECRALGVPLGAAHAQGASKERGGGQGASLMRLCVARRPC